MQYTLKAGIDLVLELKYWKDSRATNQEERSSSEVATFISNISTPKLHTRLQQFFETEATPDDPPTASEYEVVFERPI